MALRAFFFVILFSLVPATARADDAKVYTGPACMAAGRDFFLDEIWPKIGAQSCLECHKEGGDAEDSKFILLDPQKSKGHEKDEALKHNHLAFVQMARVKEGDDSRMLLKVVGKLKHGGKQQLKPDSMGYRLLAEFVQRVGGPASTTRPAVIVQDKNARPFFDGIAMLDDRKLLRRLTLSLAGRLPSDAEMTLVGKEGLKAIPGVMDAVMKEEAFYTRLREGFNDIFLTTGYDDVPENAAVVRAFQHHARVGREI